MATEILHQYRVRGQRFVKLLFEHNISRSYTSQIVAKLERTLKTLLHCWWTQPPESQPTVCHARGSRWQMSPLPNNVCVVIVCCSYTKLSKVNIYWQARARLNEVAMNSRSNATLCDATQESLKRTIVSKFGEFGRWKRLSTLTSHSQPKFVIQHFFSPKSCFSTQLLCTTTCTILTRLDEIEMLTLRRRFSWRFKHWSLPALTPVRWAR